LKIAREALTFASLNNCNVVIFDTAGRLQIDEPLVQELVHLRDLVPQRRRSGMGLGSVHRGDMADFDLGEKFGLIIVPFRPFQHLLGVREQLACLRCAHRHLEPGGRLILARYAGHVANEIQVTSARRIADRCAQSDHQRIRGARRGAGHGRCGRDR